MKKIIASVLSSLFLISCGAYSAGYRKPQYNYAAQPGDPEFFLESQFGTSTQFKVKPNADKEDSCEGAERVAYLQAMNSYYRHADAPGPWKFSAPAGKPILIAGQWFGYSTKGFDYLSKTNIVFPGGSCPVVAKAMTPIAGAKYVVRLNGVGPTCELSITTTEGTPVETHDAPSCSAAAK